MKHILSSITLILALISGAAVAQGNAEDKIIERLNPGAYDGPYHNSDEVRPLIVIQSDQDFYKIDDSDIGDINPDWIEKVDVLKGKSAVEIFGESGSNGVVLIVLKEDDKAARRYFRTIKKNKIKV